MSTLLSGMSSGSGSDYDALCYELEMACKRHHRAHESFLPSAFCFCVSFFIGMQIVRNVRSWIRAAPAKTLYYSFYLYALPIALSFGSQACTVWGIVTIYMSLTISSGIVVGMTYEMTKKRNPLDTKNEQGPLVKVIAWDHFRRTVVWINDFEVTLREVKQKLALELNVTPSDIYVETGFGEFVDENDEEAPLWKLNPSNAINPSIDYFGFHELSLYIQVTDDLYSFVLDEDPATKRKARLEKEKATAALAKAEREKEKQNGKKKRFFTTKWITKPFRSKKSDDGDNSAPTSPRVMINDDVEEKDGEGNDGNGIWKDNAGLPNEEEDEESLGTLSAKDRQRLRRKSYSKQFGPRRRLENSDQLPKEAHVESFVNMILDDPKMNIHGIPDSLEKTIYGTVLKKSLSVMYRIFHKSICNTFLFGHHLELDIEDSLSDYVIEKPDIDVEAVQDLVDVLLNEKAVNISWVPDVVERQIYTNVLVVMMGVMQTFLKCSKVNVCGHTFEASFLRNDMGYAKSEKIEDFKNFIESKVCSTTLSEYVDHMMHEGGNDSNWIPDNIEKAVFRGIYTLVLYVFKDITSEITIGLLGDNFKMRLVPGAVQKSQSQIEKENTQKKINFTSIAYDGVDQHKIALACLAGLMAGSIFF